MQPQYRYLQSEGSERIEAEWRRHGRGSTDAGKCRGKAEMLHIPGVQGRSHLLIYFIN